MKYLLPAVLLAGLLSGCTVFHGVTDIKHTPEGLQVEKCKLKVYLAVYGLVTDRSDCTTEVVK